MKNYYKILGIKRTATQKEVKDAFRILAHKYHPDKPAGDEVKFKEINEAYQVLVDKQERKNFDFNNADWLDQEDIDNGRKIKCRNPKCGKMINSDSKFCIYCQYPQDDNKVECKYCKKLINKNSKFCIFCSRPQSHVYKNKKGIAWLKTTIWIFIICMFAVAVISLLGLFGLAGSAGVAINNTLSSFFSENNQTNSNSVITSQINNGGNNCQVIANKYISEKSEELVTDWTGKNSYKQTYENIITDYSPKLNTCLVMFDVCDQDNICFIRIKALSGKFISCNLSGDDPTREQAYAYFHYLTTGEVLPDLPEAYIPNIRSECNITL